MNKFSLFLFLVFVPSFMSAASYVRQTSYPRIGTGSTPVFLHSGGNAQPFTASVGAVTKVNVYDSGGRGVVDREILLQNTSSSVSVFCSTSSTGFTATTGNRFALPPYPTGFTTNGSYDIFCISESGTVEVIGVIEYDEKD